MADQNANKVLYYLSTNTGQTKAGPVIRFSRYAERLRKAGCEVTLVTGGRQSVSPGRLEFATSSKTGLVFKFAAWLARGNKRAVNVVIFEVSYRCLPAYLLLRGLGSKLIYVSTMAVNEHPVGFRAKLSQHLFLSALKTIDITVSSTAGLDEQYERLGVHPTRRRRIANGVDLHRFSAKRDGLGTRKALGIDEESVVFLFVGLFVYRKGIELLMEAWELFRKMSRNPNADLVLVGQYMDHPENPDWYPAWFQGLMSDRNLKDRRVKFLPFSAEIEDYYAAADVFVFPSRMEGMPNVLLESMASGLPVITTKFDGFVDEDYGVANGACLAVERNSTSGFSAHMLDLYGSPEIRASVGRKARRHAESEFSLDKSIESFLSEFV